jgi:hypothetical protein
MGRPKLNRSTEEQRKIDSMRTASWREKNLERYNKTHKQWYQNKRQDPMWLEKHRKSSRERARKVRQGNKQEYTASRYGLTLEEYIKLFKDQDNKCAICGEEKPLIVDHNHATGKVRGLLCYSCNTAIGLLKDDPAMIFAAYKYLGEQE